MKSLIVSTVAAIVLLCSVNAEIQSIEDRTQESQQVQLWEGRLLESVNLSPPEKLDFLCLGLRNMGIRKSYPDHDPSVDAIYSKIQALLLAIPGHAQHFVDLLEYERSKLNPGDYTGSFNSKRCYYIREILPHFPSLETIQVLGHLLDDNRDSLPSRNPANDVAPYPANSFLASQALVSIGLRNTPVKEYKGLWDEIAVSKHRAWWEEVKSGSRAFSFLGQKVEYRVKPDGAWETIALANQPDDSLKPQKPSAASNERMLRKTLSSQPTTGDHAGDHMWVWIIVGLLVTLSVVLWISRKSQSS